MTDAIRVINGDCLEVMANLRAEGVQLDAVVTDPPYHLTSIVKRFGKKGSAAAKGNSSLGGAYARASKGFMGKEWDGGDIAFQVETWKRIFALMKPGAHLVAFSGTRTYHRMAVAIEDAGFEVRDSILDLVESNTDLDNFLASLTQEQASLFEKLCETLPGLLAWLYGSGFPKSHDIEKVAPAFVGWGTALKPGLEPICFARKPIAAKSIAANMQQHGTGAINIDACRVPYLNGDDAAAAAAQRTCQDSPGRVRWGDISARNTGFQDPHGSLASWNDKAGLGRWPANVVHDGSQDVVAIFPRGEIGSASRIFFSAKADAEDRFGSKHPTVKPVDLIAWLIRLVTPKGGLVMDPFAGSGTCGMAALKEGARAILIEREPEYYADIMARLEWARGDGKHSAAVKMRHRTEATDALPLFSSPKDAAE